MCPLVATVIVPDDAVRHKRVLAIPMDTEAGTGTRAAAPGPRPGSEVVTHVSTGSPPLATGALEEVASALNANNIETVIVDTAAEARQAVLDRLTDGVEVHWGKSKTLEDLGLVQELIGSGRWDALRPRLLKMDRATQGREMRKLVSAPDIMLGSVAAITADGALVAASATGSQLAGYAAGAGRLILVVGSQKLVPDLEAALARIREVVFPWEDARVEEQLGVHTKLERILIIYGEWAAGRTTVVLVREPVGV